jgi:hypothetical protein
MDLQDVARICHELNRAYCQLCGDDSQPAWEDAPDWQRSSAIDGVRAARALGPLATPERSHENWLQHKQESGWSYGPHKDAQAKTHPCMVPYEQLPTAQKVKDYVFLAVVRALS